MRAKTSLKSTLFFCLLISVNFIAKADDWTVYNTGNSGLTDNHLWYVAIAPNGDKLVSSVTKGYFEFSGSSWTNYSPSNSAFPNIAATPILVDNSGNR